MQQQFSNFLTLFHQAKNWRQTFWLLRTIWKNQGFSGIQKLLQRVLFRIRNKENYERWICNNDQLTPSMEKQYHDELSHFSLVPTISVVMPVYNPQLPLLREAIESVRAQIYPHWELCIADDASTNPQISELLQHYAAQDPRIKIVLRKTNGHISAASNSALELATGEFIALLDHDDLLTRHALFFVAKALNHHPDAAIIYSDEDKICVSGRRRDPYFKPDFNYELFLAQNMICHLGVYRRALVNQVGGFRIGLEGSQDYDLALRVLEQISFQQVIHIPRVLYHWRIVIGSTSQSSLAKPYAHSAACQAIAEHLQRRGVSASVEKDPFHGNFQRVQFALPEKVPLVSIIILTRDHAKLLDACIQSILQKTTYPSYEILIVDNGSQEEATMQFFDTLPKNSVRVLRADQPFNYSLLNNLGAMHAQGEILCFLNNDTQIVTKNWLEELVSFALQPNVGCVGARLLYPNKRWQHAGIILMGPDAVAGDLLKGQPSKPIYMHGRSILHQSFSAVTGACLVLQKTLFEQVNGFNERLAIAYNDVDLCLRLREAGYRTVWTPYAEIIHIHSASRGSDNAPQNEGRFMQEIAYMKQRWGTALENDPCYNPNLSLRDHGMIAWSPRTNY